MSNRGSRPGPRPLSKSGRIYPGHRPRSRRDSRDFRSRRNRRNRPRRDSWMFILVVAANVAFFVKFCYDCIRKSRRGRTAMAVASVALIVLAGIGVVRFFTRPNALEIFINESSIGIVRINSAQNISAAALENNAALILQSRYSTNIRILDETAARTLRTRDAEVFVSPDIIITNLVNYLTVQIYGAAISINSTDMVIVDNYNNANQILDDIANEFFQEGLNIVRYEFVENVEVRRGYVYRHEITETGAAFDILSTPVRQQDIYTIQPGDSISLIAARFGMSQAGLLAINPGITPYTLLQIGRPLNITRPIPILSVRTYEPVVFYETIPMPTQRIPTAGLAPGTERVRTQGREGQRRITAYIIRINGIEFRRDRIHAETIIEPITQIIETN